MSFKINHSDTYRLIKVNWNRESMLLIYLILLIKNNELKKLEEIERVVKKNKLIKEEKDKNRKKCKTRYMNFSCQTYMGFNKNSLLLTN